MIAEVLGFNALHKLIFSILKGNCILRYLTGLAVLQVMEIVDLARAANGKGP